MEHGEFNPDTNFLGKRLRELRLLYGYKQEDVAKALNVSRSTYSYYETGATRPDPYALKALGSFYGVPVNAFYDEQYEPDSPTRLSDSGRQRSTRSSFGEPVRVGDLYPVERSLVLFLRSNGYVDAKEVLESLETQIIELRAEEKKRKQEDK